MRIMHAMSRVILRFPGLPAPAQPALASLAAGAAADPPGRRRLVRRRATVLARIESMRAHGMSDTGIRRALGLSERQAVEAGIIPPRTEAGGGGGATPEPKSRADTATGNPERTGCHARGPGGPLMAEVLAAVAREAAVAGPEITGASQGRRLTPLRQLTMYLLRELCIGASLPAIGHFMRRDHTTVHYGCRMAARRLATDADYRRLCETVRHTLAPAAIPGDG